MEEQDNEAAKTKIRAEFKSWQTKSNAAAGGFSPNLLLVMNFQSL